MLDPAATFSLAGLLAIAGWLALVLSIFADRVRPWLLPLAQVVVPALLAVAYVLLIVGGRAAFEGGGFGSIEEVRALFANDSALAAGWLHYLAFDLFVGAWIVRDGIARKLPAMALLSSLPPTFMFGPAGLLLYLALRLVVGRFRRGADQCVPA